MSRRRKILLRTAGFITALLLLSGTFFVPFPNTTRIGRSVQAGLEKALRHKVEIGGVRFHFLNGPGFSISDVLIYDDPKVGIEPLAYVTSLETRVSLRSLWTGTLQFSNFRLVEPSINLVKSDSGQWNYEALFGHTSEPGGGPVPAIRIRGGRVNFKDRQVKSVFYLANADIDISRVEGSLAWRLRFSGEAARTDRPARGFGRFSGSGHWRPPNADAKDHLDLSLELQESLLGEMIALLHGYDIGLHGRISTTARLSGPIADLRIAGHTTLDNLRHRDMLPSQGGSWVFAYQGNLDLVNHRLNLKMVQPDSGDAPFDLQFSASDQPSSPDWGLTATLRRMHVSRWPELARHMGLTLPESATMDGTVSGMVDYSPRRGAEGTLRLEDVSLKLAEPEIFHFPRARLEIQRRQAKLLPAVFKTSEGEEGTLEGEYSADQRILRLRLATKGMNLRGPGAGAAATNSVPFLRELKGGFWKGEVLFLQDSDSPGEWSGHFEVDNSQLALVGVSAPVELHHAKVTLKPEVLLLDRINARAGPIEFTGRYSYEPKAARPHHFRLACTEVNALELESLFLPTLDRRRGLLARALRLGRAPVPVWLSGRKAEGSLKIGTLTFGGTPLLSGLRANFIWNGTVLEFVDLETESGAASLSGRLRIDLRRASPSYRFAGWVRSNNWLGGKWEGEGVLEAAGIGHELLTSWKSEGRFNAHAVELAPDLDFQSIAGRFILNAPDGTPRITVSEVTAHADGEVYEGQGVTQEDGRIALEFSNPKRFFRLAGKLSPFQLEPIVVR